MFAAMKRSPIAAAAVVLVIAVVSVAFLAKPIGKLFGVMTKAPVVGPLLAKASAKLSS